MMVVSAAAIDTLFSTKEVPRVALHFPRYLIDRSIQQDDHFRSQISDLSVPCIREAMAEMTRYIQSSEQDELADAAIAALMLA